MHSCFSVSHGYQQCLKLSEKEVGSLPQAEVERPLSRILFIYFWSENGEFWCMFGGILCDLKLQKRETRYRPGKSKGAGSLTRATRPHFKPWGANVLPGGSAYSASSFNNIFRICSQWDRLAVESICQSSGSCCPVGSTRDSDIVQLSISGTRRSAVKWNRSQRILSHLHDKERCYWKLAPLSWRQWRL